MPTISVIIPVYNVEMYLSQCLESVIQQTYKDFELILVDDGSSDISSVICDRYIQRDCRITVIKKTNGGLSDARNCGVNLAEGEYGIFVDSDDYWNNRNALLRLCKRVRITQADVTSFSYFTEDELSGRMVKKANVGESMPIEERSSSQQLSFLFRNNLYIASACNKLIKMKLLKEIPFPKEMVSEDVAWCAVLMYRARSFDYINHCFYCYRQRAGSISHSITEKTCDDLKRAVISCCLQVYQSDEKKKRYLGMYAAYQMSTYMAVQAFANRFYRDNILELEKYKNILKYNQASFKVKAMYYGMRVFGFLNWCKIIRVTRSFWNSWRKLA